MAVFLHFKQQGLGWERAKNIKPATQISMDDSGGEWGGSWAGREKAWEFAIILKGESEKAGLRCGSDSGVRARLQLKPSQLFLNPPTHHLYRQEMCKSKDWALWRGESFVLCLHWPITVAQKGIAVLEISRDTSDIGQANLL